MKIARRSVCMVMVLTSAAALGACNLVLGIDDVSSANGPDSGQRAFGATAEPMPDAGGPASDAGAAGQADAAAAAPNSASSPQGSAGRTAAPPSDRDAAAMAPATPDAALDEDAGESGDDAGALR